MKVIGILQVILGISGIVIGSFMFGDIAAAAMISAFSALFTGIGFLLSQKQSFKMGRKLKFSLAAISLSILLVFIAGIIISNVSGPSQSKDELLTIEQFEQLYADAKPFKGYQVDFYGRVFQSSEKTDKFQSFQVYAQNDEDKNTIIHLDDTTLDIQKGDIVHIVGEVHDMYKGKNAFGAMLRIPAIRARNVEKTDYSTAFAPAIKSVQVNESQNQNGYSMTIARVELAEQETRVYLRISNESEDTIDFHTYSSALIQSGKQYERLNNPFADYPEIMSDNIRPGVTTEGIISFQAIDIEGENFSITLEGSSDNWEVRTSPFTFEIPLKHKIASKTSNIEVEAIEEQTANIDSNTTESETLEPSSESSIKPSTPLPNSLYGGRIPGFPSGIGDSTITLFDMNGEVLKEVDTGTGFAYQFSGVVYYTTSQLNINGNITEGEVIAMRFIDGDTVLGVRIGDSTQNVIEKLGKANEVGFSDLDGNYVITYTFGDYRLDFYAPDEESLVTEALYKKH